MKETEQKRGPIEASSPRTRRPRPLDELKGVGPVDREKIARWLDANADGHERQIGNLQALIMTGQGSPTLTGQLQWATTAIQIIRQLAWSVRTGRGGPMADWRKRRQNT